MRKYYLQVLLVLSLFCAVKSEAQDFSNKGKEFWLCFPQHVPSGNNLATLSIWITSDRASSGTITMTNGNFNASFNIPANGLQEIQVPHSVGHISNAESGIVIQKSIKIKTDPGKPAVVAYAQQWGAARSAATLLLPTNVLGKKYFATSFTQSGSNSGSYIAKSQFQIIATKPNTQVKITPRTNGTIGNQFTITLPLTGDMYQYQSDLDLTGTLIESVASGNTGCLPIAVFSGSSNITFGTNTCAGGNASYDPLFQQQYPVSTWGKNFGFIPFADYPAGNPYRILASEDNTSVYINGSQVATLNTGEIYPSTFTPSPVVLTQPTFINADRPIAVIQYAQRQNCSGGGFGDPDMVLLNPIEQNIQDITIFSSSQQAITRQWINILIKTIAAPSFTINGNPPIAAFQPFTPLPGYSYVQALLSGPGSYRLAADSGFNAIAYGFSANFESYAYSAGTNVKDLYQQIGVSTQYGIEPTPSVCTGSPFRFKVSLPYCADSLKWDLSLLPGPPSPATPVYTYSTCTPGPNGPDSTTVVNGKTLYWYSIPTPFTVNTAGTFPVTITTYSPNTDGCGSEQEISFELNVYPPPTADFSYTSPGCQTEPVQFTDITVTTRPSYIWNWNFGDPASGANNTSSLQNPTHTFSAPGSYTVTFNTITTPGCVSNQITKTVVVPSNPTATITVSPSSACLNASPGPVITFTATGGLPPYTFTYNIGGGPNQTISTTGTNTTATLNVPTSTTGTIRYNLVKVQNTGSTTCFTDLTNTFVDVSINANATLNLTSASATANQTICQGSAITNITYSIGGGGSGAVVSGLPTGLTGVYNNGVLTISGTTNAPPNTYSFTVTTTGACAPSSLSGSIIINAGPVVALTSAAGTNAQQICRNTTLVNITYSVSGGSGTTVSGLPAGVTGNLNAGVFTISGTPTQTGTFNYIVSTTSNCGLNNQTGTITVNDLPTANFTVSAPACENRAINFTDASLANSGVVTAWNWNFGDGNNSSLQNPSHAYTTAGSYTVTLTVTTDKGCQNPTPFSRVVAVNANPRAGFMVPDICLSDLGIFTDTSSISAPATITGWEWNFGDPASGAQNISTTQNGSHLFSSAGTFTVTHMVFASTGCADTIQHTISISGSPFSDFSILNPNALCANDSVTISNLATVNPGTITKLEIYWDNVGAPTVFDVDNSPAPGENYSHLYPNFQSPLTRNFDIRFRAYSGITCIKDTIKTITVNAAPKVQFNNIPDVCHDAPPFQVTQASEIGGVPGNGVFSGPGISPTGLFTPASVGPGVYNILFTYTSSAGGCIDSLSRTIRVLDSASARFTFNPLACDKTAIDFNSSTSTPGAGTIQSWSWNFGDPGSGAANTSSLQNPSHLFTTWGTYNVSLSLTTSNGCRSTVRTIPVTVNPIPRAAFSYPASACLPSANIQFNNSSTIADGTQASLIYSWNFGDPASGASNTSSGTNPSHIYNTAGPFSVNLQVTSAAGCVHDTTIIVNNIHPQPTGLFTSTPTDVCVGESMTFTDNSDPADGTTTQWNWDLGNGVTRNTPGFTYTYPTGGTYNVSLFITNSFGCRSTTFTKTVTANAYPVVNAGPDLYILEGGSDTLQPVVNAINPTFLWTPNQYFVSPNTIQNAIVNGVNDITYTLTVTGRGGCVAADQVNIIVLKGPEIPNIFSPNGDGIHDTWVIKYLDTYPGGTVEVFNRYGQRIFRSVGYTDPWDGTVNGKPVPMGTYYYVVDPKNGRKIMSGYVDVIR